MLIVRFYVELSEQNENSSKTAKKKRIPKHKKKAWRITSDIADVERFLEDERLEERLGAPFAERESKSLFVIDTENAETLDEKIVTSGKRDRTIGPLKCFAILNPSSAVNDPIKKRNRVRLPEERRDPLVVRVQKERRAMGKIPKRIAQSIADREKAKERAKNKAPSEKLRSKFDFDLWGKDGKLTKLIIKLNIWGLYADLKTYHLEKTGKRVFPMPLTMKKKTTALKAVEAPHPGTSYNPTFEDHQNLLRKAYDREITKVQADAKIERKVKPMMKKMTQQEQQKHWMDEMSQGLAEEDEQNADETTEDSSLPVKMAERKTKQQRRKEKLAKIEEMRRKKEKAERIRQSDVFRLRTIHREIGKEEKDSQVRQEVRKQIKVLKEFHPKTLGRLKYEEPMPEMNFSDEITGSLRTSKTEGNLLVDRFKSMQKRNILEPRVKQSVKRKYQRKSYAKKDYKQTAAVPAVWDIRAMTTPKNILRPLETAG
nr:EOG090X07H9 [Eulimnadia texana]